MEQERTIQRVLVACVGESAAMLLHSLKAAEVESVAIFLEESADAPYVDDADYPVLLPSTPGVDPFSDLQRVASCAMDASADGLHPGTRRMSAEMVQLANNLNLAWIGPKAEHLGLGTDNAATRRLVRGVGMELLPQAEVENPEDARSAVDRIGPPLLEIRRNLPPRRLMTVAEARSAAALVQEPTLFERAVQGGRVVILTAVGDGEGGAVVLPEMEDTLGQRGQVVLRESPSQAVNPELRARMWALTGELASELKFLGVMSVAFVVGPDGIPWFHRLRPGLPESWWLVDSVSGVDLVGAQLVLASGEGLGWDQEEVQVNGHALHVRILATSAGVLGRMELPEGEMLVLRGEGAEVPAGEELLAFRVHASTRHAALVKAQVLLQHLEIEGVHTNLQSLRDALADRKVWEGFRT